MEEKDFSWVLRHLATSKCKLPILETIFFYDNEMQTRYSTGKNQQIQRFLAYQTASKTVSDCVREMIDQFKKNSELSDIGPTIGYYILHNRRKVIDSINFTEVLRELQQHIKVPYIQTSLPQIYGPLKDYTLEIYYTRYGFVSHIKDRGESLEDHKIFDSARDLANVIVNWLESSSNKRVIYLELDLFEDYQKSLWLGRVIHCKVISPTYLKNYNVASQNDLFKIPRKSKKSLVRLSNMKKEKAPKEKEIIVPLRILTPERLVHKAEDNEEDSLIEERNYKRNNRRDVVSKHFIELISRTNIANKHKGLVVSSDLCEEEFERIVNMITNSKSEKRNFKFTSLFKDIVIEAIQERARDNRSQVSAISRTFRTPEQAFHSHVKAKPSIQSNKASPNLHKVPRKSRNELFQKRKTFLMKKSMSNQKLQPIFSQRFSEMYSSCFKPIRLIKSHSQTNKIQTS